jgi:hypothetical protein
MKKMKKNKFTFLLLPLLCMLIAGSMAAQEDSAVAKTVIKLKYYNDNSSMQYLVLENFLKTGKKIEPLKNKTFDIFLDSNNAESFISKAITDNAGKAKAFIPPSLKALWEAAPKHKFIVAASAANKNEQEIIKEFEIAKARITLDTATSEEGIKSITVMAEQYTNEEWKAIPDMEMKIGIARLGGILSAGDEETYTTDSTGAVTVELKKDSLPGDLKGNIVLVAKVEDNDQYGNLLVNKTVPWGVSVKSDNTFFDQRTLWSTRFKTPLWLLFMAYSIVIGVWGTIIYLITQIIKIKKLGAASF